MLAVTHIAGPGSSPIAQHAQFRIVCVLEDCAEHITAMSLMRLSAKASINSITHGDESERHRPGIGEVSSTKTCSSHHCHGGLLSGGLTAALNPFTIGFAIMAASAVPPIPPPHSSHKSHRSHWPPHSGRLLRPL